MQDEATIARAPQPRTPVPTDRSEIDRGRTTLAAGSGPQAGQQAARFDPQAGQQAAGFDPQAGRQAARFDPQAEQRPHMRLWHGMRRPANWLQLVRFGVVGGSGFAVNLAVYAVCVHAIGIDYRVASVVAWLVAVLNNFLLNRHWTFDAAAGSARLQGVRFFVVSLAAEVFSLGLLTVFVESAGIAKVPAQALAVAVAMPLNFLGNKLWSFRGGA